MKEGFTLSRKDELKNVILKTEELIKAPNCYAGLREKAETWLAAIDTPKEFEAAVNFVKELKADITPIDGLVAFAHSKHAAEIFGDGINNFIAHAEELKKSGAKYCDCVACKPSLEILANEKLLLKR